MYDLESLNRQLTDSISEEFRRRALVPVLKAQRKRNTEFMKKVAAERKRASIREKTVKSEGETPRDNWGLKL